MHCFTAQDVLIINLFRTQVTLQGMLAGFDRELCFLALDLPTPPAPLYRGGSKALQSYE